MVKSKQFEKGNGQDDGVYINCQDSSGHHYVLATRQNRNKSRRDAIKNLKYWTSGFSAMIPFTDLPSGRYDLSLIEVKNNILSKYLLNKSANINATFVEKPKNW